MFKINEITKKIMITRGDTAGFSIVVKTKDGSIYQPTSSDTITFTVSDINNDIKLIVKTADSKGIININPEDTNLLPVGTYIYDVELTNTSGINTIIPLSYFEICQEVTR